MIAYGIFTSTDDHTKRIGAKIGNDIVDLKLLGELGGLGKTDLSIFETSTLNNFIRAGLQFRQKVKQDAIAAINAVEKDPHSKYAASIFVSNQIKAYMPVAIGGYTDFYASRQHATNIGKIFRPDAPLLPNWVHIPIGYNGRASSVVHSGHVVKRPNGQILVDGKPQFSKCKKLDIEIELGLIIGKDNPLGEPINIKNAHEYIFGVCIVNDWSARDIQAWEYQPLGPFTSKSFLTSISSFIVPIEELEEYKIAAPSQDPKPMDYLQEDNPHCYDIRLEARLATDTNPEGVVISKTNFKDMYWTMHQWIAHHTVTGCNLQVGDLLASGTISGDTEDSLGSLMEITVNGKNPVNLPNGETRTFLEDGDTVIINAFCGNNSIGEVIGTVV